MPRSSGWSVLAERALELAALALVSRILTGSLRRGKNAVRREPQATLPEVSVLIGAPADDAVVHPEEAPPVPFIKAPDPLQFLRESADAQTKFFRASDDEVEVVIAFFSDGRVRLADDADRRFAGMLEYEKGDLLEIGSNQWSRLFVRATPGGGTQLELHGGPYDARVLTCAPLDRAGTVKQ